MINTIAFIHLSVLIKRHIWLYCSHTTVRLNTFEQRSLSLFIRRPTMGKTIGEPGWSVGVSAVETLRNGDFRLRNASPLNTTYPLESMLFVLPEQWF